jgi:hypothetical protein
MVSLSNFNSSLPLQCRYWWHKNCKAWRKLEYALRCTLSFVKFLSVDQKIKRKNIRASRPYSEGKAHKKKKLHGLSRRANYNARATEHTKSMGILFLLCVRFQFTILVFVCFEATFASFYNKTKLRGLSPYRPSDHRLSAKLQRDGSLRQ